jgi:hypothetical protein
VSIDCVYNCSIDVAIRLALQAWPQLPKRTIIRFRGRKSFALQKLPNISPHSMSFRYSSLVELDRFSRQPAHLGLDPIFLDIIHHRLEIPCSLDHARERDLCPKLPRRRSAFSCTGHKSRDQTRHGSQKVLQSAPTRRFDDEMKMRTDVLPFEHRDSAFSRPLTNDLLNLETHLWPKHAHRTPRNVGLENNVQRSISVKWPLDLASPFAERSSMAGSTRSVLAITLEKIRLLRIFHRSDHHSKFIFSQLL